MKPIGLYVHVPFCDGKCPYCDFYSMRADDFQKDAYVDAICRSLQQWGEKTNHCAVDTIYFGGGTPILLGAARLNRILDAIRAHFTLQSTSEITLEANPAATLQPELEAMAKNGFNRISFGLQSVHEDELRFLGRRHHASDAQKAVQAAKQAGFRNISLDLMLGLQGQTVQKAEASADYCAQLGVQHISAYLLKVEEETPFASQKMVLPDEEEQREIYLAVCKRLELHGFFQYEISNFAKSGFESRHNLKYWNDEEYLGLGPAAHSFLNGKRFFYPRDLTAFVNGNPPTDDGVGGDFEEYAMLRLRLSAGIEENECKKRFGYGIPQSVRKTAKALVNCGLLHCDENSVRLTREGFLVSNAIIVQLLDNI